MRNVLIVILLGFVSTFCFGQQFPDSLLVNLDLDEIIVFENYNFKNIKEQDKYAELESDLRVMYPMLLIVRKEYERINRELDAFYGKEQEEAFLKWYENYAKESYMHHLSVLNVRQGRLFLKMVSRELDSSPFDIIKKYRNGFRAFLWQGAARVFFANLRTDYDPMKNPMIEHIMRKLEAENNSN